MTKKNKASFCPLPFRELSINTRGELRLCCHSEAFKNTYLSNSKTIKIFDKDFISLVVDSEEYKELRYKMETGEEIDICQKCYTEEAAGVASARVKAIEKYGSDLRELSKDSVASLDLRLGNKCNLKCIMCNPCSSSSWVKEWNNYSQHTTVSKDEQKLLSNIGWPEDLDIAEFSSQFKNLERLYFTGGDPLINKDHKRYLKKLIEDNNTDLELKYNINGCFLDHEYFDLWDHFKTVKINFSLDGVGELNEFIRYPSVWPETLESLKILKERGFLKNHYIIEFHYTVQALNTHHIKDFIDFLIQEFENKALLYFNILNHPLYLNSRVLSQEKIERVKVLLQGMLSERKYKAYHNDVSKVLNYLCGKSLSSYEHLLIKYLEELNVYRNVNGLSYYNSI